MKTGNVQWSMLTIALLIMFALSGCAKKPTDSNVDIAIQFGSYTTAKHQNPFLKMFEMKKANAAVSSLKMCFKRLRFKAADQDTASPSTDSDNVDFPIGEVNIANGGAALGSVSIPEGTYKRIEFDLNADCASGKSIQLTNGNGSYSSASTITIKFSGTFTADASGTLTLGVQTILDQLNAFNGGDLKVSAEAISGVLSN